MSNIPVATKTRFTYENIVANCPACQKESIFNRRSDLGTLKPLDGNDVQCLSDDCGKLFRIRGDCISPPHEMLISECYELIERKHYMNCILSLCQAYEVFFSLFFRVELLYKPFGTDDKQEPEDDKQELEGIHSEIENKARIDPVMFELNQISDDLFQKIGKHQFYSMRSLFLWYIAKQHSSEDLPPKSLKLPPRNLKEAKCVVYALPERPTELKKNAIQNIGDKKLAEILIDLKNVKIHELRNQVAHKAYRPTRAEAEAAQKEAVSILTDLSCHLQLRNDFIRYRE